MVYSQVCAMQAVYFGLCFFRTKQPGFPESGGSGTQVAYFRWFLMAKFGGVHFFGPLGEVSGWVRCFSHILRNCNSSRAFEEVKSEVTTSWRVSVLFWTVKQNAVVLLRVRFIRWSQLQARKIWWDGIRGRMRWRRIGRPRHAGTHIIYSSSNLTDHRLLPLFLQSFPFLYVFQHLCKGAFICQPYSSYYRLK